MTCRKDWNEQAKKVLESSSSSSKGNKGPKDEDAGDIALVPDKIDLVYFPSDSAKKPYREVILASGISIFDFQMYAYFPGD